MPPKRSTNGERNTVQRSTVKRSKKQQGKDEGKKVAKRKFPAAPTNRSSGKAKRVCSKRTRPIFKNNMAASDTDEKDSDLSSDDERGFFQMAESDEDTEDASETDMAKLEEEFSELKEQVYQEKLGNYKKQLQELNNGSQSDYLKRLNQLEKERDDRLFLAEVCRYYEIELLNKECENEKKMAKAEFENKKVELKETLLHQLNEKKKSLELEKQSMELTNDILEIKPAVTRKLRRRPNDPPPVQEKRRKNSPAQINLLLDESEMNEDLKALNKLHAISSESSKNGNKMTKSSANTNQNTNNSAQVTEGPVSQCDIRIEDGKLFFDRKWYHRGQQVYIESKENKEIGRISGVIHSIGQNEIWVKKTSDNNKMRINITQLQKGKYTIRRRSS